MALGCVYALQWVRFLFVAQLVRLSQEMHSFQRAPPALEAAILARE
jgi:hypothetical protein